MEDQRRRLIREAARDHNLPFAALEKRITAWKQALKYPEDLDGGGRSRPIWRPTAPTKPPWRPPGWWDYEDLIARPTLLLDRDPELRESYRAPLPPPPGG